MMELHTFNINIKCVVILIISFIFPIYFLLIRRTFFAYLLFKPSKPLLKPSKINILEF